MTSDLVLNETTDSTPTVESKMMASFRIDRDDWKRFGELAKRERLTVTQLITDYVEKCLDADRSMYGVSMSNDTYNVGTRPDNVSIESSVSMSNDDVLKLIDERVSIAVSTLSLSNQPTKESIENAVLDVIGELTIPTMETVRAEIESSIVPLETSIEELETYVKSQIEAMRDAKKFQAIAVR